MVHQVNEDPVNALVYKITEKHQCADLSNNITQHLNYGIHTPYLVCCYHKRRQNVYCGTDCGKKLLGNIDHNTILVAHNATHDYHFLVHYLQKKKN